MNEKWVSLSPNKEIYHFASKAHWKLTSTLSIFYRILGAFLAAINYSYWGFLSLIVVTFLALSYYMSNGVCYLWWDSGPVLDLSKVHTSGILMLFHAAPLAFLTLLRVLFS
ncbi:hypothetical protein KP509_07G055900 [Ceratopteris richardii]|uniref:Uncharacterized protein n=1 Tax=Ceratopteris richardii TaxID=49495 RepID=A0A8T2UB49_CERRI|nr:hypothetical protein KP509_07G055900 [Ceratopteris richardii]